MKKTKSKVIMLEFNELSPTLIKEFIKEKQLPNFLRLYNNSVVYTTEANVDVEYLEPWVQWVTVHTGLSHAEHKVYRLGQAENLQHKSIWDHLSENKLTSWICGSMNVKWDHSDSNVAVLPDPWSTNAFASPESYQPFYKFVQANVQEHSNVNNKLTITDNLNFLAFMLKHGLSFSTIHKLLKSVYHTVTKSDKRWQKATVLDWLQYDIFAYHYKKESPDFATLFSNSTAHFQHQYWRYMEPDAFSLKPTSNEQLKYGDAVLYAYKNHDQLIGKVLDLIDDDTTIILSSALSQQPYTEKDEQGGKRFYRPHDIHKLPMIFNLKNVVAINPVMSHQFQIICENVEGAQINFDMLSKYQFEEQPLFSLRLEGNVVFGGCSVSTKIDVGAFYQYNTEKFSFDDVFYLADNLKSGMHHPHGVFWVYNNETKHENGGMIPLEKSFDIIMANYQLN